MKFEVITGEWRSIENSLEGIVDDSLTARCRRGKEDLSDYDIYSTLNLPEGQAGIIVNYSLTEEFEERYFIFLLDTSENSVSLVYLERKSDGTLKKKTVLAWRKWTIDVNTDYNCLVRLRKNSIFGYLSNIQVIRIEDLTDELSKGLHGFECFGSKGSKFSFKNIEVYRKRPLEWG